MEIDELRDKIARLSTALEEATAERTQVFVFLSFPF